MKIIYTFLNIVWRFWFGLIVILGIIAFFPLLWILLRNSNWYNFFHYLCRVWSRIILFLSGFSLETEYEEKLDPAKAYIICPNHVSYVDIPLTFAVIPSVFVFLGKKSLSKLPFFGSIYKKAMILVDRSNNRSSYNAYKHASQRISNGVGIAVYPEGGIPSYETRLDRFKSGAFRMAIEQNVDLVPVTFIDNKKRFPCDKYIGSPGKLRVYIHKPIKAGTYTYESIEQFKKDVYSTIENKLTDYESR